MAWNRLGCVYVPDGSRPWARTHAALPVPVQIDGDTYRVFFSSRDKDNRSHVGWVDVNLSSTPRVLREATEPVLAPGEDGSFDDSGVGIGSLVEADDGVRLYYMGWNLGRRAAWRNAIGFARGRTPLDGFQRYSPGPVLDRSPEDPYTLSYPCVLRRGEQDWWMWYGSNLSASISATSMRHTIKLARSHDGIGWRRDGAVIIALAEPGEYAIARPSVIGVSGGLIMAFACRGERYRIGVAASADWLTWTRIDGVMGLDPSPQGWDSEMTCYPALFRHRQHLWLAYNGNSYGSTGIGFAVWDGETPSIGLPATN